MDELRRHRWMQRLIIAWLAVDENMPAVEIHRRLVARLGQESALSKSSVVEWVAKFKAGIQTVQDAHRSGRPNTLINRTTIAKTQELIAEDDHIRLSDLAQEGGVSYGAMATIVHKELKLSKLCSKWLPHDLTFAQ